MSRINPLARELSAKIVYYGPGLSGKTTTLQYVHRSIKPERRGELVSLATEGDRTIFFDFLPLQIDRVGGMGVRLQLYTVPGQVFYGATRKLVLNGADGVVFVADSQPAARERNLESLDDLKRNLEEMGTDLARFPLVIQYNKRDLPGVSEFDALQAELNTLDVPAFGTCATSGEGVFDALRAIVRQVVRDLRARRSKEAGAKPREQLLASPAPSEGLAASLQAAAEGSSASALAAPGPTLSSASSGGLSFAPLWGAEAAAISEIEGLIAQGAWGPATRATAAALAALLDALPGATAADGPLAKALILGLDGRDYLALCRLASAPDEAVDARAALAALHLLVGAQLKLAAL